MARLATLDAFKARIGIPSGTEAVDRPDAYLTEVQERADAFVEDAVGRGLTYPVTPASTVEYFSGDGGRFVNLSRGTVRTSPTLTIETVIYDDQGGETYEAIAAGEFVVTGEVGSLWVLPAYIETRETRIPRGVRNLRVVYHSGYNSADDVDQTYPVPKEIEEQALGVAVWLDLRRKDVGLDSRSVADAVLAGFSDYETQRREVQIALARYTSRRF